MSTKRFLPGRWRHLAHSLAIAGFAALFAAESGLSAANAQGRGMSVVRDAEIEALMRDYARPVLQAAGISSGSGQITLINDSSFNAFVASGQRIFLNVGAITQSETPNELIGVIAHEAGHIAGGHLVRLRQQVEQAQTMAIVGMLLGAGAMAGAAAGGVSGGEVAQMGQAVMSGTSSALGRSLLAYQRGEEMAADRAAINYLNATGQSAAGMLRTFERFANESMFLSRGADRYSMSHPMPRERIAALEELARSSPHFGTTDSAALQQRHDLARAKIAGFLENAQTVAQRYRDNSLPARYARAISAFRFGDPSGAVAQIDALLREQPNNPYFWELKGQALTEMGRPAEAVQPLRQAVSLAPNAGLIRVALGHALVASQNPASLDEAISQLERGVQSEPESANGFRHLARAHALKGDIGRAELATARGHFVDGRVNDARQHAARAQAQLPQGSPGWLQADDILAQRPPRNR